MNYPPYCPNPKCGNHQFDHPYRSHWYWHKGHYHPPSGGSYRRFQCKECKAIFTMRTFSIDYFTKKKVSYQRILSGIISCSSIRALSRALNCNTETIQNRIRRLARNMIACSQLISGDIVPQENGIYTADGLESFITSQFFPTNINILVGKTSQFIYDFSYFVFKRKGRMTERQKEIMEELYKTVEFEEKGATRSFNEILTSLHSRISKDPSSRCILDTDENRIYRSCLKSHPELGQLLKRGELIHRLTSSKKKRNFKNKLFPVNYIDREIRKDLAEHVRETVRFGRSSSNAMERFGIYLFWHNYLKPFRINRKNRTSDTHGEAAGCDPVRMERYLRIVYRYRIPYSFVENKLTTFLTTVWEHRVHTPAGMNRQRLPKFLLG